MELMGFQRLLFAVDVEGELGVGLGCSHCGLQAGSARGGAVHAYALAVAKIRARSSPCVQRPFRRMIQDFKITLLADSARRGRGLMRGSDRMHALYLHFTDAPLSDYARAENHSAALQITFIFYSPEICMISKS